MGRLLLTHSCWRKSYNFGKVIVEQSLSHFVAMLNYKSCPLGVEPPQLRRAAGRCVFCLKNTLKTDFKIYGRVTGKISSKTPNFAHVPAFSSSAMGDRGESTSQPESLASRKNRCADNGLGHFGPRPLSCPLNLTLKTAYLPHFPRFRFFKIRAYFPLKMPKTRRTTSLKICLSNQRKETIF